MSAIGLPVLTPVRVRPTPSRPEHPLHDPLLRMSRASEHAHARLGLAGRPLEQWILATELGDSPSPRLDWCLRRVGVHHGTADRLVMSSLFFSSYVWQLAVAALGCYLLARRVPDTSAENVAIHVAESGRIDEVRFLGGGFAALADDRAADHPDAVVVPDVAALRELLVRRLTSGHLEELIGALQAQRGLGTRALWAAVEDRCVGALLWLAKNVDGIADVEAEAEALTRTPPFLGTSGIVAVEAAHGRELVLQRGFCCLYYRVDGQKPCSTCPLRSTGCGERRAPARPAPCTRVMG